jgi:hypothetical protein
LLRPVGFYIAVALGLLLAVFSFNATRVRPANSAPTVFSADRAMADVAAIARAPHPMGSAENERVRAHLAQRLRGLDFAVETYSAPAIFPAASPGQALNGGWPQTLVAVRPGRDRSLPPVAIMSHYDSVTGSPGAADDAAGVAASLETARAIAAAGPVARDLVLIVTDGEEPGLLGARAFFAGHPLARRLGAVINLEARGSSGPTLMFETSPQAGKLVGRFIATTPRTSANSLLAWVYAHMPNDTDFTLAREAGIMGLNFGFIGAPFDYHSASAVPANLDRRSLQSMGDQTLSTVQGLLTAEPLPARAESLVYSDIFGLFVIAYPAWAGWGLLLVAVGLFGLSLRRLGLARPRGLEILRGAGGFVLILTMTALALRFLGRLIPPGETLYQSKVVAEFGWLLTASSILALGFIVGVMANLVRGEGRLRAPLVALGMGIGCCLAGGWDPIGAGLAVTTAILCVVLFARPTAPTALWAGFLALGIVLAVVLQAVAPQLAFLIAWPTLIGCALAAGIRLGVEPRLGAYAAAIVVGAVAMAWLARLGGMAFDGLGIGMPEILALFAVLALLVLAPLAARTGMGTLGRTVAAGAIAVSLVIAFYIGLHNPASPRTPQPSHVLHVTDLAHNRTLIVSSLRDPDPWTRGVLGAAARTEPLPAMLMRRALVAPAAPVQPVTTPTVTAARDGARATLTLAAPGARELRLSLKGVPLKGLTVAGRPAEMTPNRDGWAMLRWYAPRDGVVLAFDAPPGAALDYRIAAITDGWPAAASLPARTASTMAWQGSDSTVVMTEGKVGW